MSSHNDDLHNSTAKRNLTGGVVGLNSISKIDSNHLSDHLLTETQFSDNAATGTAWGPEKINDNTDFFTLFQVVGQYCEILFNDYALISEYRQHGIGGNTGRDGEVKIQYLWGGIWIDNTINILPRVQNDWSDWIKLTFPIITKGIRMVSLQLDSIHGNNSIRELDIRG